MIAPAKTSTDHEELHRKVLRIQGEVWGGYGELPQRMSVRQATGDIIIRPRRRPPTDDTAVFRRAFLVALSGAVESSNVQVREVLRESFESLRRATEVWGRLTSIQSDVFRESLQAITEVSKISSLGEDLRTLLDRRDKPGWNDAKNDRRCDLIDKEIEGTLLPVEKRELETLQRQMLAYRRKVAPLPLKEVRELHQHLLKKAAEKKD